VNFYVGAVKHGDEIGEVSIPSIPPGGSTVVVIPWYPPNPADYTYDQHHFCIAARIESPNDPMFSELNGVGININTKNNNNIAWKNLSVYNLITTDYVPPTAVFIRGVNSKYINIRFLDKGFNEEFKNKFFDLGGVIEATLDEKLFERAQANGSLKEFEIIDKNKILIKSREASITNLPIDIGETFGMTFDFRISQDFPIDELITLDLIQEDALKGELEGGERFALTKSDKPNNKANTKLVSEATNSKAVTVYPNPTSGIFKININNEEQGTLKVMDINNRVIFEEKTSKKREFNVNIANQIPGIYIVQFISNNGTLITQKLIKN
jgi:hypothetical protein